MNTTLLIVIVVLLVAAVALFFILLFNRSPGTTLGAGRQQAAVSERLRSLVQAQRVQRTSHEEGATRKSTNPKDNLAVAAAEESGLNQKKSSSGSKLTLDKRLRFALWTITPIQFRAIQVVVTLFVFVLVYLNLKIPLQICALIMVPLLVDAVLERAVKKRFEAFDADYPVLLLSYVSLLKTGMNTINGLEAAAKGLDDTSLVRAEVELLIERLRLGLTEEQAISAFGENIAHPELELFVQSLLLSRKVGGQLSSTLERLAKQVRKRQQFREQAIAHVGMERGSIWAIAAIMSLLLGYLAIFSPEFVFPALKHDKGRMIFESSVALIFFGFYWSRKVTNIKV